MLLKLLVDALMTRVFNLVALNTDYERALEESVFLRILRS